jgi:hypothetical protein
MAADRAGAIPPAIPGQEHHVKLLIAGREYPAVDHSSASLLHLMQLKQQTRDFTEDGKGLGMHALQAIGASAAAAQAEGEVPENADLWMAVMVFLTRRAAGENVTFLEAIDVPLESIQVVSEPGDEASAVEADPTTPGPDSPETPESDPSADATA